MYCRATRFNQTAKDYRDNIDNAYNLVFWCRILNKLEPCYAVYIMQQ